MGQPVLWINIVCIGIGGACGALLRALIGHQLKSFSLFPFHTLLANCLGCFLIGLLIGLLEPLSVRYDFIRLGIITGFLGSLTTFSTFSYEVILLSREDKWSMGAIYLSVSIVLSLILCGLGILIARSLVE